MHSDKPKAFYVYITASSPRRVIYVGMTSDLAGRTWEHRERVLEGFTKRYYVDRLVFYEHQDDATSAARREKSLKRWRRDWKIKLIEEFNPTWKDLFANVVHEEGYEW